MSGNQKQPAAGGPQTQRYSSSPYQPIVPQPQNSFTGSDGYHSPAAPYVQQTQGPNQGPGLRNIQPTGPPNQSSTPPNTDIKVSNLGGQIQQMQFVQNPGIRAAPGPSYFQPRGAGGPPTQATRMPNQHRAPGPHPIYQPSPYVQVQPVYMQQQYYSNQRPLNSMMAPQTYAPQVFQQQIAYPSFSSPAPSGVPAFTPVPTYQMYPSQNATMAISRAPVTPVTAAPSNTTSGNLPNPPLMPPPGPTHLSYSRSTVRQRRSNAIAIIDPVTGEDKLDEIFDAENTSQTASGESSARQTPQPAPPNPNKEVQAAFAKQVAQAINEDRQHSVPIEQPPTPVLHEPSPPEQSHAPLSVQPAIQRYDVYTSNLQCDAKEFVSQSKPIKEATPIVSANSDAAEVILPKKDRESPVKGRKPVQRDPKPETPKEFQPKETVECDKISSIVKEDIAAPVPQLTLVNTQPSVVEPMPPVTKDTGKEEKKSAKKPAPVESASPELEILPQPAQAATTDVASNNGKAKGSRNKNTQNHNGKAQPPPPAQQPPPQPQQQPPPQPQQQPPTQPQQQPHQQSPPSVPVPAPQPPKANNKSNKSKELNMKGANKEGSDMDAFNDNNKEEINANVLPPNEISKVVLKDVVNSNTVPHSVQPTTVPPTLETDNVISETKTDSNENVTTIKSEPVKVNNVIPASTAAPVVAAPPSKPISKPFDVTSIIRDTAPMSLPPFPINDNKDEIGINLGQDDKTALAKNDNNKVSMENSLNDIKPVLPYKPGQWAPDRPDGKKVYERDFLMALKMYPASLQKPTNIPESVVPDDRNRQIDSRLSMGGRTDFISPPFPNYGIGGNKPGSQRGTLTNRNSQSNKRGSRGGDKISSGRPMPKVSISLGGDVKLHESENAWKPAQFNTKVGEVLTDDDKKTQVLYRKVRSVLNKLTPQKFDTLVNQVRQLQIDTKERLQGVIDLVFKKAIDEPSFSLAYAMMCKEIQNMQVSVAGDEKKNLAFRTLLITRCQMEFEKQSLDESERNAKVKEIDGCNDADKKKELTMELEEYDRRLRMKSVGTIRFIGELFKQQMLTASIMRRCLQTLLDNKDDESLECLCKLLTTVGKELESKNSDLSSIIEEMKRITEGRRQKVNSRIRFMLQDVLDLKESKWVSRRGDTNPKTIDQIQKEAETEQMNIHVMNMNPSRRDDRRDGGGPRGGGGGGSRQKVSDDGWSSVGSRNNRQQFSIQTDKFRINKIPLADEPLGSSSLFGNWGKGAGSVRNPQPSMNTNTNMYAALENMDMDRRPPNSRGNKDPYSSKGPSMERNSYKSYDGRGSRSGSQHRDMPMRSTGPPPASASMMPPSSFAPQPKPEGYQASVQPAAAPKPPSLATATIPKLSEEQLERRIRNSLDEFITGCCTTAEYFQDISSSVSPSDYPKVVYESYNYILEKSQTARLKTGELFAKLIKSGNLSIEDFAKGFEELLGLWEDLVIDIPQIWQYFSEDLVSLLLEEVLPFTELHKLLESLIKLNMAKKMLKPLFALVVKEKGPNFLHNSWRNSGLKLSDFMPESDVQSFIKENNLEFLVGGASPVGQSPLSYEDMQKKLSEFFQSRTPFDDIVNWISANIGNRVKDPKFIRALASSIFENSIFNNKLQPEVLTSLTKLIQKYVDNNTDYELQCLYALQSLAHKLEHPQGLLLAICDRLYEDSTFCQESFIAWENSTDPAEQEAKGVALKQLTSFFTQLKENEEDDDYSSNSEDGA